jgi:GNAT superfamily N-acetyltransferase
MYYISHLATSPSAAGHGLGGKLVEFMVERGKREGVPVTLLTMTERHVRIQ